MKIAMRLKTGFQPSLANIMLATIVAATVTLSSAAAEEATADISVYAGLEPVMQLECSDMNFGVYQIARGDRGIGSNPTRVMLSTGVDGSTGLLETFISFVNAGQDQIALSDKPQFDGPQPAICVVTGSRAKNTEIDITRDPAAFTPMAFSGVGANPFATTLIDPKTSATGIVGFFNVPASVDTNAEGNAEFTITGEVRIPNNLSADNYGSYKAAPLTITVTDGL